MAQGRLDFIFADIGAIQVFFHHGVAGVGGCFYHAAAPLLGAGLQRRWNLDVFELDALAGVVPHDGLHLDQVDHAVKIFFGTDRNLHQHRIALEAVADLLVHAEEVGADPIHLVDERQPWHGIFVGLAPDGFGLRLDSADSIVDHAGAVQHPHRPFDFNRKVDVARGIDDIDPVYRVVAGHALPETGGGGRGDSDAAFLLLFHPVHGGGAVMHFADLVADAGIKQDPLGGGGLAGVDMGADADIAIALNGCFASHDDFL